MFTPYCPVAALLAALATSVVFVFVDFLLRYAAQKGLGLQRAGVG